VVFGSGSGYDVRSSKGLVLNDFKSGALLALRWSKKACSFGCDAQYDHETILERISTANIRGMIADEE
jgi:hypothetical protein